MYFDFRHQLQKVNFAKRKNNKKNIENIKIELRPDYWVRNKTHIRCKSAREFLVAKKKRTKTIKITTTKSRIFKN